MKEFVGFKGNYRNVNRYKLYLAGLYCNTIEFQNDLRNDIQKRKSK